MEEDEQDPLEEYENDLDNEQSEPEDEDSMNNEEYVDIPGITMDDNAEPLEEVQFQNFKLYTYALYNEHSLLYYSSV